MKPLAVLLISLIIALLVCVILVLTGFNMTNIAIYAIIFYVIYRVCKDFFSIA